MGNGAHIRRHGRGRAKRLDARFCLGVCLGIALTACAHAPADPGPPPSSGILTLPETCSAPSFYFNNLPNGWERTVIAFECPRGATLREGK